jgi:hypothetical protein
VALGHECFGGSDVLDGRESRGAQVRCFQVLRSYVAQEVRPVARLRSCKILVIQGITAARLGTLFELEYVSHNAREH